MNVLDCFKVCGYRAYNTLSTELIRPQSQFHPPVKDTISRVIRNNVTKNGDQNILQMNKVEAAPGQTKRQHTFF